MNFKVEDYTGHVDTRDFIRAFWVTNSQGDYLHYEDARCWFGKGNSSRRIVALYLSSRARYVFQTQEGEYLEFESTENKFNETKSLTKQCWLYYTKANELIAQNGQRVSLNNDKLIACGPDVDESFISVQFERISAVSGMDIFKKYRLTRFSDEQEEEKRFGLRVEELIIDKKPIKLYVGCGLTIRPGFLHIDLSMPTSNLVEADLLKNLFRFPIGGRLPIPDSSVDFIFSEDFIEHLPQMIQVKFLAECLRVLKPKSVNRVNTPCLLDSMRKHSNFILGADGVYEREWLAWGHESLFTKGSLKEIAGLIGYDHVHFTSKNESISEYHTGDVRPKGDRIGESANIYADLIK